MPILAPDLHDDHSLEPALDNVNTIRARAVTVRCSHCQKCCQATEMELSSADIKRLERRGYDRADFSTADSDGIHRLRNVSGWCFFYDSQARRCREYRSRPLGCVIYPVILSMDGEAMIDDLCPVGNTLTREEFAEKERTLHRLIETIDGEARRDVNKRERGLGLRQD